MKNGLIGYRTLYINLAQRTATDIAIVNGFVARPMPKDPITGAVLSRDTYGNPAWEVVEV